MQAQIGDRLVIRANSVGVPDRNGEIIEVRGDGGGPPYLVRWPGGDEALVWPGPDASVEPARNTS